MDARDVKVVRLEWQRREQRLDESPPARLPTAIREIDADEQLGRRHRSDCDVVFWRDDTLQLHEPALGRDQDARVED